MGCLPKCPISAYNASAPVTDKTTAPNATNATIGDNWKN